MAFTDPQSITIDAVATSLPRINVGNYGSEYRSSDGLIRLSANSAYGKRTRQVIRVDHRKIEPNLVVPAQNDEVSMSAYLVLDRPRVGYTNAQALSVYTGFNALITASAHELITKVLGGES